GSWASTTSSLARTALAMTETSFFGAPRPVATGGATGVSTTTKAAKAYNPRSGSWINLGDMNQGRCQHQQTTLLDGRILVTGGRTLSSGILKYTGTSDMGPILHHCEVYDPGSDTWSVTGRMTYARFGHGQVLLPDGRVLVAGGWGFNPTSGAS